MPSSPAYYNENNPHAAAWLRNLIDAGLICPGDVDERSIVDVQPQDLQGYTQVHLFAGIGGWSYAARLAGWPDTLPLWTGSCPCQPFSSAGLMKGTSDVRHLWPEMSRLISACQPLVIAGEQVASRAGLAWLDGVQADLEAKDYAFWAADLCAASVGAPHIRQRLWWLAHSQCGGLQGWAIPSSGSNPSIPAKDSGSGGLANHDGWRRSGDATPRLHERWSSSSCDETPEGDAHRTRGDNPDGCGKPGGFWSRYDLIPCGDGKSRRIEPGTFPLAHGIPNRLGRLRGYGNAIVPQVAATILRSYLISLKETSQCASS